MRRCERQTLLLEELDLPIQGLRANPGHFQDAPHGHLVDQ
jgi:hypothetical protein